MFFNKLLKETGKTRVRECEIKYMGNYLLSQLTGIIAEIYQERRILKYYNIDITLPYIIGIHLDDSIGIYVDSHPLKTPEYFFINLKKIAKCFRVTPGQFSRLLDAIDLTRCAYPIMPSVFQDDCSHFPSYYKLSQTHVCCRNDVKSLLYWNAQPLGHVECIDYLKIPGTEDIYHELGADKIVLLSQAITRLDFSLHSFMMYTQGYDVSHESYEAIISLLRVIKLSGVHRVFFHYIGIDVIAQTTDHYQLHIHDKNFPRLFYPSIDYNDTTTFAEVSATLGCLLGYQQVEPLIRTVFDEESGAMRIIPHKKGSGGWWLFEDGPRGTTHRQFYNTIDAYYLANPNE
jgi:hypothetical protein